MNDRLASPRLDLRNRVAGRFLRLVNPLTHRLISAGLPTGAPKRAPHDARSEVRQAQNGTARHARPRRSLVRAGVLRRDRLGRQPSRGRRGDGHPSGRPLPTGPGHRALAEEAGAVLRRALQGFRRSRVLRALVGRHFRPPIGVLWRLRIRIDDTLEDYTAEARRHPLFELRPIDEADAGGRRLR